MARAKEIVLQGGGGAARPCKRMANKRDWTKAKEAKFIEALGATCNVTLSAEQAGVGNTTVYNRRRRDAAFRRAWNEAIAEAYARLEIETLERAINGRMRTIVAKDGSVTQAIEHDERTALTLLRLHRDTGRQAEREEAVAETMSKDEANELRERLMAKLKRVRIQLMGREAADSAGWERVSRPDPVMVKDDGGDRA